MASPIPAKPVATPAKGPNVDELASLAMIGILASMEDGATINPERVARNAYMVAKRMVVEAKRK